jgi:hypothetical protein
VNDETKHPDDVHDDEPHEAEEPLADAVEPAAAAEPEAAEPPEPVEDAEGAEGAAAASAPAPAPADDDGDPADALERRVSRLTRRGFLTMGAAAAAGWLGWRWVETRQTEGGLPWPLRRGLEANRVLWESLYDDGRLVPTYPASAAEAEPRVNGRHGLDRDADPAAWRLRLEGMAGGLAPLTLGLADVKRLPRVEVITELRCIEGWSMVVHWAGARFADFISAYPPPRRDGGAGDPVRHPDRLVRYVGLETPDRGYYVGLDMASALHPQTLLAYEINGEPLTWDHGAPLRLVVPIKYGIKSLKRIGKIRYQDDRPADFWAERKYDWYAGH